MKKEELLELGLNEEQAAKVIEKYGNAIPKSRFDEVNEAKKQAEAKIAEMNEQIETLKKSASNNEELQKQITSLQEKNETDAKKYAADLKDRARSNSINLALTAKKARNIQAARALMELDDADFDENHELSKSGIAKIEKVFTENAWAFDGDAKSKDDGSAQKKLTGITPVAKGGKTSDDASGSQGASAAARFLATLTPQSK